MNNLKLPSYYFITPNISCSKKLLDVVKSAVKYGIKLIQLRCDLRQNTYYKLAKLASYYSYNSSSTLLIKGDLTLLQQPWCHGLQLTAQQLLATNKIIRNSSRQLVSASCHNSDEISKAEQLGLDFITLSPVKKTSSHPEVVPIGINDAKKLTQSAKLPTYWLGGQKLADLILAKKSGACGIAGISTFSTLINNSIS